jgi:hypothetical protein
MTLPPIKLDPPGDVVTLKVPFKKPVPEERFLVVDRTACQHYGGPYLVNDTYTEVTCGQCKQKINPMWVLQQLAQKETRWHETRRQYQEEMKRLSERSKTKCEHCKQMTRISRR